VLRMTLAEIAHACKGACDASYAGLIVNGLSTDTRSINNGNLFVPLKGERYDGNDHIPAAYAAGATACLTSRSTNTGAQQAMVRVADTLSALQHIAHAWRLRHTLPVIAITGSNGKSTVKEMIAAILVNHCDGNAEAVLATHGNLNNHIGVPLTLAMLSPSHRFAVVEAGMNHFGEISLLTRLIAPQVALITNAGPAHLEGVGSLEGVARAKAEIFEGLGAQGVAIINGDDAFANYWMQQIGTHRGVRFGTGNDCEVRGLWHSAKAGDALVVHAKGESVTFALAVAGDHNRMNALAACAAVMEVGVPLAEAARGLAHYTPMSGRQTMRRGRNGATIIDDTYNANFASIQAGMDTLRLASGTRIVALGQMAELGAQSETQHKAVGEAFKASGLDALYATGERMRVAVEVAGPRARWFATKAELIAALLPQLAPQVSVLVKGSRSSAMEEVVVALVESMEMEAH
jgi:UDP-N-acetylmuramoyl-tripeptide--D-alanyl-D-alanine ligase